MKRHVLNFFKGIGIGIANMIPGFSGGTMAIMLNVYDLFVYAFANVFNDFKNVVKKSWSLFLGIMTGAVLALFTILKLLEIIPFITVMFFVGLIIGSIPSIYKKCNLKKIKIADIIAFMIAVAILIALPLINTTNSAEIQYNYSIYLIMLALGIICSASMVIPGISGSLVLMAFGYFEFLMKTLRDFLQNLFNFSLNNYWNMFFILACFAIGCIIGLVFVSKLIGKMLQKYPKTTYCAILGLILASPFSILYKTNAEYTINYNAPTIIFSIISLIIGIVIVLVGEYISKKKLTNNQNKQIENKVE